MREQATLEKSHYNDEGASGGREMGSYAGYSDDGLRRRRCRWRKHQRDNVENEADFLRA
jgi:hypothetical protein